MSDIYLDPEEVKVITGYTHRDSQRTTLEKMGYTVKVRPDGSFWVPRAQFMEKPEPSEKKYSLNLGALSNGKAA